MNLKKITVVFLATAMVSIGFGLTLSDNVQAAFVENLSNNGLSANFYPVDVKWDHTGTMAVVVGYDTLNGPNAYSYFSGNDTWVPLDGYYPGQSMTSVDYYYDTGNETGNATEEPTTPNILLVDADAYNTTWEYYWWPLFNNSVNINRWDVYDDAGFLNSKPNSADMSSYDMVVWICSYDMWAADGYGYPFNSTDEQEVSDYLDGGGNFFLSSTSWTSYRSVAVPWGAGAFSYDYLAMTDFLDASDYQDAVQGVSGDAAFAGFGSFYLDWNRGGWGGQPTAAPLYCDQLTEAFAGAECMFNQHDLPPLESVNGGVKKDNGTFKTMFMSFPVETLSQADADDFWNRTLAWYDLAAGASEPPMLFGAEETTTMTVTYNETLDQSNEWMGNLGWNDVGGSPPDEPMAQSFIPTYDHISKAEFYMYSDVDPGDEFLVEIRPDVGGEPSFDNITYGWIDVNTIPVDPARGWAEVIFENDGATLTPGKTYWLYVDRLNYNSQQNWSFDYAESYNSGLVKEYVGFWDGPMVYDWLFRTYANVTSGVPSVTIGPDMDNGIFSESNDESNGAGQVIRAGMNTAGDIRRSFIHYDIASNIPAGSTIDHVELKMYCNKSSGGSQNVSINRVQVSWGEGTSDDGGTQSGDPATSGDTTWHYSKYPTTSWFADGGSYAGVSASINVPSIQDEFYTWGSTSWMVTNVQDWLDTPSSNYGWAVLGDEGNAGYIKQFSSRENENNTRRPELTVFYTLPAVEPYQAFITPEKDNTIYDNAPPPEWSNGWGDNLVLGMDAGGFIRRSLIKFDIESAVPAGATITGVNLTMYCDYVNSTNPETIRINNLNKSWGEAGSHAFGDESSPDGAQLGDVTWNYAYMNTDMWASSGGDFIASPSAFVTIDFPDRHYIWSSATMISDVQGWLDNAGTNHGWIFIGNEGSPSTVKRFGSRSNRTVSHMPMLNLTYSMDSPNGTGNETGNGTAGIGTFWMCGNDPGMPATGSTVYKLEPANNFTMQKVSPYQKYGTHIPFTSLAVDDLGNPLCAGEYISSWYYYNGTDWCQVNDPGIAGYRFQGIDFNPNDDRFYLVGDNGASQATVWYSETLPISDGATAYRELSGFAESQDEFCSIAWNHVNNYGMVVGADGVFLVQQYAGGPQRLNLSVVVNNTGNYAYYDCDWDTDGWNEAAIVGTNDTGDAYYWRYYHTNPQLLYGHHTAVPTEFLCCGFKPPSSPKWLMIPIPNGGVKINIQEKDESGEITLNADQPHIFTVDMWKQSDFTQTSVLNQQVDADTTYTFFIEGNYTIGGIDNWKDLQIDLTAWYDEGKMGTNSKPEPSWSTVYNRTRQFNLTYDVNSGTSGMIYPVSPGSPPEFDILSIWEDPVHYGADNSHYHLYINVTFGAQTYVAPSTFGTGPATRTWDANFAFNDVNSWDFNVTAFNIGSPTARNVSFEEFGIKEHAAISVSGSPGGSAPPGTVNFALTNPSQISYSTNSDYFVNVSIPHLYKDGILGPDYIPATDVQVRNTHSRAISTNSDISAQTAFAGPNMDLCVWGKQIGVTIFPAYNGTESAGPSYSDYTEWPAFEVTEVYWWVSVPVGLPEGVYRGTITVTLWH